MRSVLLRIHFDTDLRDVVKDEESLRLTLEHLARYVEEALTGEHGHYWAAILEGPSGDPNDVIYDTEIERVEVVPEEGNER
jgi:hypothetical protein